ncbi:unnamed protein product [Dovyalis caffra]|uniref:Uncharacterized protein n=1 Tax=Dovyalis caffra TaxID=77055 RepID=A0AAV1RKJ5_9ROSI|nr:unnamed protein product [Dovyalis caffra]
MATALARIARKSLTTTTALSLNRHFATETAAAATASSKSITPSADRVKWDYRGQRQIIPLGQWLPKIAVDAYVAPNVVLAGQVTVYDGASVWNGAVLRGDLNKITVGFCSNVQERCVVHAAWNSPTEFRDLIVEFEAISVLGILLAACHQKYCNVDMYNENDVCNDINLTKSLLYALHLLYFGWLSLSRRLGLPAETSIERYVTIGAYSLLRSCTVEPECIIGQHSILMEGSLLETHSILEAGSVVPPGRRIPTGELWAGNPARFVRTLTHEETLEIPKLAVAINDLSKTHFSEFLPYSTVYLEVEKLKKKLGINV